MAKATFPPTPKLHAAWRVIWADYTGKHDWIGPRTDRGKTLRRKTPPVRQAQDFLSREGAEDFVQKLRRQIKADELVVQIVSLRNLAPCPPEEQALPSSWPVQRRGDPPR
jgi:hypothetical protein